MTNEKNTFAEMEKNSAANSSTEVVKEVTTPQKDIDITDFSDTAIGDKVKYIRPDLKDKIETVDKFQVFAPDTTKEPKQTQSKTAEFWIPEMTLFWESKNKEGMQNKETISGAKVWKSRDGTPNPDINFWYEGGVDNDNQSCILWETVAKALNVEPKDMSPRQFIAFLNSKPKFKIQAQKTKNYKAAPGSPAYIYKNMPGELVKG